MTFLTRQDRKLSGYPTTLFFSQSGVLYPLHKNCLIVPHTNTVDAEWLRRPGRATATVWFDNMFKEPVVHIFTTPCRPRKKERTPPLNRSGRRGLCSDTKTGLFPVASPSASVWLWRKSADQNQDCSL